MQWVVYNGGTDSYCGCTEPKNLTFGTVYEVLAEDVGPWQTNYTLRGVKGKFNSAWFDPITTNHTYFAISNKVPVVGESCKCRKLEYNEDGKARMYDWQTRTVMSVKKIVEGTYLVITSNSTYIVKVEA